MPVFIGTSGWNYPHWKENFYPADVKKKDWFNYYSENFNTVEVNYSFYNWPTEHILKKWHDDSPKDFVYTMKAPRLITHMKKLKDTGETIKRFYSLTKVLGKKMGCHLFQLPPNFTYTQNNFEKLRTFLKSLDKKKDNAIEFRSSEWWSKEIFELLDKHKVGFITVLGMDLPEELIITGNMAYLRFHGHDTKYSKQKLRSITNKLKKSGAKKIYVYFNNDAHGYAPANALEFKEML